MQRSIFLKHSEAIWEDDEIDLRLEKDVPVRADFKLMSFSFTIINEQLFSCCFLAS